MSDSAMQQSPTTPATTPAIKSAAVRDEQLRILESSFFGVKDRDVVETRLVGHGI